MPSFNKIMVDNIGFAKWVNIKYVMYIKINVDYICGVVFLFASLSNLMCFICSSTLPHEQDK
jgi:hypothetical protein